MPKSIDQLLKGIEEAKEVITKIHSQLDKQRVEASAGAGLVKVVVNGNQEVIEIHIDPQLIKMKDKELLQDLIKSAVNEARKKAMEASQELMKEAVPFNLEEIKKWFPVK